MRAVIVSDSGVSLETVGEEFLGEAPVLVDVAYSDLNYKDALAVTGRPGVVRATPLIAGIDVVGKVAESDDPTWAPGDWLVLNGAGLSETRHGGFATRAALDPAFALPLPGSMTPEQAGALGTAGYTAALSVLRIVSDGISPSDGPVLVTGATGGVGSVAVMLLTTAGFEVVAVTGRHDELAGYLGALGAASVVARADLEKSGRPLQKATYSAVVDCVGGGILSNAISLTKPGGVVAACGLAASAELPTSVLPFILRGVTLAGIDSVWAPNEDRADAWRLLAHGVDFDLLAEHTTTIGLDDVIAAGEDLLAGRLHGRTLVAI